MKKKKKELSIEDKKKFLGVMSDKKLEYPERSNTGQPLKDKVFDWVVRRYEKKGLAWRESDQKIFSGFIYGVGGYFSALLFFAFFGFLFYQTNKLYGFERAVLLALLMILFRVNILIKQIVILNRKL